MSKWWQKNFPYFRIEELEELKSFLKLNGTYDAFLCNLSYIMLQAMNSHEGGVKLQTLDAISSVNQLEFDQSEDGERSGRRWKLKRLVASPFTRWNKKKT